MWGLKNVEEQNFCMLKCFELQIFFGVKIFRGFYNGFLSGFANGFFKGFPKGFLNGFPKIFLIEFTNIFFQKNYQKNYVYKKNQEFV